MKKLAFMLALAFVFLVGGKIVVEHKVWAGKKEMPNQVFSIPVNENGEFVIRGIPGSEAIKKSAINVTEWQTIENIQTAVIIKFTKNPNCYLVCSGGSCVQKCFP